MKSERRHELSRNALGAELFRIGEFLRRRGSSLAWGALGVAAVVLGIVWYVGKTRAETVQAQAQFTRLILGTPSDQRGAGLEAIAAKTSLPRWAALSTVTLGDDCRERLVNQWYSLGEADRSALRSQAEGYYHKAMSDFPKEESAVARARYGLGKLAEDWGDLDAARTHYEEVIQAGQASPALQGEPIWFVARQGLIQMGMFQGAVYMPATAPATGPTSGPATSSGPATRAATQVSLPTSGPAPRPATLPAASRPAMAPASGSAPAESG